MLHKGSKLTATQIVMEARKQGEKTTKNSVVVSLRGLVKYGVIKSQVTGWNRTLYYVE